MKVRIKFRKWGVMKFIGHLDVMRYFQKAMRRANIDIAYSTGFSPHQIMSFAAPLGVGLTSDGEYLDIEANSVTTSKESVEALNRTMVDGMEVVSFRLLPEDAQNAMSIVAAADYRVSFSKEMLTKQFECVDDFESLFLTRNGRSVEEFLDQFYSRKEILIQKKTKKSEAVVDIRPMIYELGYADHAFVMKLATGSAANLKPSLVLEAMGMFEEELSENPGILQEILVQAPYGIQTHRVEVYANTNTSKEPLFVSLEALGEDIVQ